MSAPAIPEIRDFLKRKRSRRNRWKLDKGAIVSRILADVEADRRAHNTARDLRLQRYAKFRQWTAEPDGFPWPDSSNLTLPDLTTRSLRVQDTLHNAVMSSRPIIQSRPYPENNLEKAQLLDDMHDYQLFVEQPGEKRIGELADFFTNEGFGTIYVAWVREDRKITDTRIYDPLPVIVDVPEEIFLKLLQREFSGHQFVKIEPQGWDWELLPPEGDESPKKFQAHFYNDDDQLELVIDRVVRVYDGPRWFVYPADDVLHPARVANLQPPSISNPGGAPHVILFDRPTLDEVKRLIKEGVYDLVDPEDRKKLDMVNETDSPQSDERERQLDAIQGETDDEGPRKENKSEQTTERYRWFGGYDVDKDGLDEQVVFVALRDPPVLLMARTLTELYPSDTGVRPFAEGSFIEVPGRREGFGLLELMEASADNKKVVLDQTVDAATIAIMPPGFYRPQSNVKPEPIPVYPGSMYPVTNPAQDIFFPNIQNQAGPWGLNLSNYFDQGAERLSVLGELQFGRVPTGKASALRTRSGMQTVLQQGEARPERILRRFFMLLRDAVKLMHQFNKRYLTGPKKFRVIGYKRKDVDPFRSVPLDVVQSDVLWDFTASVHTASREGMQEALERAMGVAISPINVQLGLLTPEKLYNLETDYMKSLGVDEERYLAEPMPGMAGPRITADDAITSLAQGQLPVGEPYESGGAAEHLEKLLAFQESDDFGSIPPGRGVELWQVYIAELQRKAKIQQRQEEIAAAAAATQQQLLGGAGGGQTGAPPPAEQAATPVQGNELLDESMPGGGGGANP